MPNGSDIIVRGGSVEVEFDSGIYPPEGASKHKNKDMKLVKIVVKDANGTIQFDSKDQNVSGWEVKAFCKK